MQGLNFSDRAGMAVLTLAAFGAYNVLFLALAALWLEQNSNSYFSSELYLPI